jgi:hypothetical protein
MSEWYLNLSLEMKFVLRHYFISSLNCVCVCVVLGIESRASHWLGSSLPSKLFPPPPIEIHENRVNSPLLFNFLLEAVSSAIRKGNDIKCTKIGNEVKL